MRIHLVTMPWHPIDLPSLQVGLLHALVTRNRPDDDVREFHGSLLWAEFLLKRSDGRLRPGDYVTVGSDSIFDGLGDWVFTGVLYDDPSWGVARSRDYALRRGISIGTASDMRVHAAGGGAAAAHPALACAPYGDLTCEFPVGGPPAAAAPSFRVCSAPSRRPAPSGGRSPHWRRPCWP
ncbi:hypothetical protein QMK19_26405 [Streptomyces sp. H10-C2]|uniref:hypothetical protein n=1 Tax=unclassified Streptomyces TaxID=2593676 RepID=UPI0024BA5EE2|nr:MULTISPECIES: hypothetical protein [unclassified Streptomyces]MDJ0344145.1 hypothetical protein [Streptomyces sp. PH10-H1]MDJ0373096.1 hypothetical protein [Streptomyces sp. H10-C2]